MKYKKIQLVSKSETNWNIQSLNILMGWFLSIEKTHKPTFSIQVAYDIITVSPSIQIYLCFEKFSLWNLLNFLIERYIYV